MDMAGRCCRLLCVPTESPWVLRCKCVGKYCGGDDDILEAGYKGSSKKTVLVPLLTS